MKNIIKYFYPKKEASYFEDLKTNFFIVQVFVGVLVLFMGMGKDLIMPGDNFIFSFFSQLAIALFLIASLFILKQKGLKIAGNIYYFVVVFILLVSFNILPENISPIFKYAQGFFSVFAVLVIGMLFASRWLILVNAGLIFLSTTHVFIYAKMHEPANIDFFTTAYTTHTIALVFITAILYFTNKLAEKAVLKAEEDARTIRHKNMELAASEEEIRAENEEYLYLPTIMKVALSTYNFN